MSCRSTSDSTCSKSSVRWVSGSATPNARSPIDEAEAPTMSALIGPAARRSREQLDGLVGDVVGNMADGADLCAQLGCGRRMMRPPIDQSWFECREIARDSGVTLCPHLFGQGVVGDLTNDVAAELPTRALANEQPSGIESCRDRHCRTLTDLVGELAQRRSRGPGCR